MCKGGNVQAQIHDLVQSPHQHHVEHQICLGDKPHTCIVLYCKRYTLRSSHHLLKECTCT